MFVPSNKLGTSHLRLDWCCLAGFPPKSLQTMTSTRQVMIALTGLKIPASYPLARKFLISLFREKCDRVWCHDWPECDAMVCYLEHQIPWSLTILFLFTFINNKHNEKSYLCSFKVVQISITLIMILTVPVANQCITYPAEKMVINLLF